MKIVKEFREFAARGNVIDLAIGIIIGAAFGKIVSSLVADIIMPPVGLILGGINLTGFFIALDGTEYENLAAAKEASAPVIAYGQFINEIINFLIVAFCVFLIVKTINSLKRKEAPEPEAAPTEKDCPYCLKQVPIKATRCAHCTSQLAGENAGSEA